MELRDKIIALIADVLGVEPAVITEDTKMEDVEEWDSLMHVMIIGELESRLGISIDLEEAAEMESVSEILEKAGAV